MQFFGHTTPTVCIGFLWNNFICELDKLFSGSPEPNLNCPLYKPKTEIKSSKNFLFLFHRNVIFQKVGRGVTEVYRYPSVQFIS